MRDVDGVQHGCRDFAGERAFFFPVHVLRADKHVGALGGSDGGVQVNIGRTHDDLVAVVSGNQR